MPGFFLMAQRAQNPVPDTSRYGVSVIRSVKAYHVTIQNDPGKQMAEIKQLIPFIVYDLRYATTNNFMHRRMYPARTRQAFLRQPAAKALTAVAQDLALKGYGLKVFDAYRPYAVTISFWELVKDERYVANPAKGSGHNRGLAIDLTLISLQTGQELDMGTGFDNFTDSAHQHFTHLPPNVLQNRQLLKETMEYHGFSMLETEWWHYSWPNDRNYEVLDIPFKNLR